MPAELHPFLANLLTPEDDGACRHLTGMRIPPMTLPSTSGLLDLSTLRGRTVLCTFPGISRPDEPLPTGHNESPGAPGCTWAFRDRHAELQSLGAAVFGLSTQSPEEQAQMAERLPFPVISDADLRLTAALRLPTFIADNIVLLHHAILILRDTTIARVVYPAVPPDRSVDQVIAWLRANPATLH